MSEYKKIIAKINNEEFFPIYILVGDENYFADNIIKSLTSGITPITPCCIHSLIKSFSCCFGPISYSAFHGRFLWTNHLIL